MSNSAPVEWRCATCGEPADAPVMLGDLPFVLRVVDGRGEHHQRCWARSMATAVSKLTQEIEAEMTAELATHVTPHTHSSEYHRIAVKVFFEVAARRLAINLTGEPAPTKICCPKCKSTAHASVLSDNNARVVECLLCFYVYALP